MNEGIIKYISTTTESTQSIHTTFTKSKNEPPSFTKKYFFFYDNLSLVQKTAKKVQISTFMLHFKNQIVLMVLCSFLHVNTKQMEIHFFLPFKSLLYSQYKPMKQAFCTIINMIIYLTKLTIWFQCVMSFTCLGFQSAIHPSLCLFI